MTAITPEQLADALFATKPGIQTWGRAFTLIELRELARAAAEVAWHKGYADGLEDGDPGYSSEITLNPYRAEPRA